MNPREKQIDIDVNQTEQIFCSACNNDTFTQVFYMRKVSAVLAGRESILPIPTFECSRCGHVNDEFKPQTVGVESQE